MRIMVVLLLAVTACSSTPSSNNAASSSRAAASPSIAAPSPAPAPGGYAVIVNHFLEGAEGYTVSLVATDGHLAAMSSARRRSQFVQFTNLSTSATTLYYLDGDADVRYLRPDGSGGLATHVDLGPHQVAAFAVSPDDKRIAVSVLDYTQYPVGTRLFVEDLNGHANHVELFSSKSVLEWPAGWHNDRLVIALGLNARPQNAYEGFERGHGYHIADASTGNRLLSLCDGGDSYVPESSAGTVCVQYPKVSVVSWDGVVSPAPLDGTCAMWGPLSPAGGVMATRITTTPGGGCRSDSGVFLINARGTAYPQPNLPRQAAPEGWIDADHLFLVDDMPPNAPSIVDVKTGLAVSIANAPGFFAASLPGGL